MVHLFRLLDAAEFKVRLAAEQAEFALISSDSLYHEVIRDGPGLIEPDAYQPITITNKDTHTTARTWLSAPARPSREDLDFGRVFLPTGS